MIDGNVVELEGFILLAEVFSTEAALKVHVQPIAAVCIFVNLDGLMGVTMSIIEVPLRTLDSDNPSISGLLKLMYVWCGDFLNEN